MPSDHISSNTQLLDSAYDGDVAGIQSACAAGADIDTRDERGEPALLIAMRNKHVPAVLELLTHNVPTECHDEFGNTPLHYAATYGIIEAIDALIDAGAAVDAPNTFGDTPLHSAANWHQPDAVHRLLERGADPSITNNEGKRAGEDCTLPAVRAEFGLEPLPQSRMGLLGKLFSGGDPSNSTRNR